MSSPSAAGSGAEGAYVPPHRRRKDAHSSPRNDQSKVGNNSQTSSHNCYYSHHSNNHHSHHHKKHNDHHQLHRHQGGGCGRGGGGRGRGGQSTSPHRDGRRHRLDHLHQQQKHHSHRPHLTEEQLQHQEEQLHVLTDAINRICCINLERRPDRWRSFQQHLHQSLGKKMGRSLSVKVERFPGVDGIEGFGEEESLPRLVKQTWDATINAKWGRHISPPMTKEMTAGEVGCALSHIRLWKELVAMKVGKLSAAEQNELLHPNMLILEDDALFYSPKLAMNKRAVRELNPSRQGGGRGHHHHHNQPATPISYNHDFLTAFQLAWSQLPEDFDIWYLGFSDRGERIPVHDFHLPKPHHQDNKHPSMTVRLFRPTYGFHTHAYVLTSAAAQRLLDNLPVVGPLDVWLADNQWFDMKVYCSVVEGEGWHETGAWLITQNRKADINVSDVAQSGRTESG